MCKNKCLFSVTIVGLNESKLRPFSTQERQGLSDNCTWDSEGGWWFYNNRCSARTNLNSWAYFLNFDKDKSTKTFMRWEEKPLMGSKLMVKCFPAKPPDSCKPFINNTEEQGVVRQYTIMNGVTPVKTLCVTFHSQGGWTVRLLIIIFP